MARPRTRPLSRGTRAAIAVRPLVTHSAPPVMPLWVDVFYPNGRSQRFKIPARKGTSYIRIPRRWRNELVHGVGWFRNSIPGHSFAVVPVFGSSTAGTGEIRFPSGGPNPFGSPHLGYPTVWNVYRIPGGLRGMTYTGRFNMRTPNRRPIGWWINWFKQNPQTPRMRPARFGATAASFLSSHQQALAEQRLAGQMMPTPETATASSGPSANLTLLYAGIGALAGNFFMRGSPLAIGGGGIAGYMVAQEQHKMEVKKAQAATEAARTQQRGAVTGPTSCPPGQRLTMTFPATCVPIETGTPTINPWEIHGSGFPPPAPSISPECQKCRDQFPTTQFVSPASQSPAGLAPAEIATWEKCRDQQCFPSFDIFQQIIGQLY